MAFFFRLPYLLLSLALLAAGVSGSGPSGADRPSDAAATDLSHVFAITGSDVVEQVPGETVGIRLLCVPVEAGAVAEGELIETRDALRARLSGSRFDDAEVAVWDGAVEVTVGIAEKRVDEDAERLKRLIETRGRLEFRDPDGNVFMDKSALKECGVTQDDSYGLLSVVMKFTEEGAAIFAEMTGANVGKRLSICVDGELVSAPVVSCPITGGECILQNADFDSLGDSFRWASDIESMIKAEPLPVPLYVKEVSSW